MKIFASDFETTTDNSEKVAVWSAESIEINYNIESVHENCVHQNNIRDFIEYVTNETLIDDTRWYFHNLKFDGSYVLDYLAKSDNFTPFEYNTHELIDKTPGIKPKQYEKEMPDHSYSYMVSDKNVIYSITIKIGNNIAQFRDSMKLLPFTLKSIGKSFGTKHQKLEMNFNNKYEGYNPTDEELKYIENDVFVLKEAIEIVGTLLNCSLDKIALTIGSVSLTYFKQTIDDNIFQGRNFRRFFPDQTNKIRQGQDLSYDDYVRKSYKGGWCYLNPRYKNKLLKTHGFVYDVNSLYPSVMHSSSGCFYPIGKGKIKAGDLDEYERDSFKRHKLYYFIRFRCNFKLKAKHLPTVQIKNNPLYNPTIWLESSDIYDRKEKAWIPNAPEITMTCIDWELFKKHYDITNLVIYDHMSYRTIEGVFDKFIEHWYDIKKHAKGALRQWAKLILNNCYGKFSTAPSGNYVYYTNNKGVLQGHVIELEDDSRAVYIPIGSAITSWARCFTIKHAQANYKRFVYADTDSIHCIGYKEEAKYINESPTELCCWKNETNWDKAIFCGQKRYIEHVIDEDGEKVEPYNNIKCCGMNQNAKNNLDDFLRIGKYDYDIFKDGLIVSGNIKSKRVNGGIRLTEQGFTFHDKGYIMG